MHWSIVLFVILAGYAAVYSGLAAHWARREANNWYIGLESKQLTFHGWTEFLFALTIGLLASAIAVAALVL